MFSTDLRDQGAGTFGDIEAEEYDAILPVPYWAWIDRRDEVTTILGRNRQDDSLKFVWPVLRDMLDKCCCVVSGTWMEISPHIPPLQQFGSFYKAKHRIFMSATVTDDSFLVKGLRLSADTITKPLTYPKEKWFGEKMILIPSLIDGETGREKGLCAKSADYVFLGWPKRSSTRRRKWMKFVMPKARQRMLRKAWLKPSVRPLLARLTK